MVLVGEAEVCWEVYDEAIVVCPIPLVLAPFCQFVNDVLLPKFADTRPVGADARGAIGRNIDGGQTDCTCGIKGMLGIPVMGVLPYAPPFIMAFGLCGCCFALELLNR
jgi:hypothetical protein